MALTKQIKIDQITVLEDGLVLVREVMQILEDGIQISKQYHRTSLQPGQDISDQPQNVQDICNVAWTPEVIAEYQAKKAQEMKNVG